MALWVNKISKIEQKCTSHDIIVPLLDTLHHKSLLNTWLAQLDFEVNTFNQYVITLLIV